LSISEQKGLSFCAIQRKLEAENMELRWINENHAEVVERPEVTLSFAKFEDNSLIDTVLGMLLQSFSK
jgi:hypothetical protein